MERPLPLAVTVIPLQEVGCEHSHVQDNPVQDAGRKAKRPDKIDEEDDAQIKSYVPTLVL